MTKKGIVRNVSRWFTSYLGARKQFVKVGGGFSSHLDILCGVPQGSILGPLLFNIYINDMCVALDCELFLYADDALLFSCRSKTIE